jgi:FtsZ-binding cell division protein ZapB
MVVAEHERCKRRLSAMEKKCTEQAAALANAKADRAFMEQVNASMKANQSDWQSRVSGTDRDSSPRPY